MPVGGFIRNRFWKDQSEAHILRLCFNSVLPCCKCLDYSWLLSGPICPEDLGIGNWEMLPMLGLRREVKDTEHTGPHLGPSQFLGLGILIKDTLFIRIDLVSSFNDSC